MPCFPHRTGLLITDQLTLTKGPVCSLGFVHTTSGEPEGQERATGFEAPESSPDQAKRESGHPKGSGEFDRLRYLMSCPLAKTLVVIQGYTPVALFDFDSQPRKVQKKLAIEFCKDRPVPRLCFPLVRW